MTKKDQFSNLAFLEVTESAANTLTFEQLQVATTLMSEKAALIIHRAELTLTNPNVISDHTDYVDVGITLSDRVDPLYDLSQPEVLFYWRYWLLIYGAVANGLSGGFYVFPSIKDFTELPGGGIIVPADRLYAGIKAVGGSAASGAQIRLYYTVKPLAVADYWDLVEARRVMST